MARVAEILDAGDEVVATPSVVNCPIVPPGYVTFHKNPDESDPTSDPASDPASGPASGFATEGDTDQTHNVLSGLPGDAAYSPLWSVEVYDNAAFDEVIDLASVEDASRVEVLARNVAIVNCPVVEISAE